MANLADRRVELQKLLYVHTKEEESETYVKAFFVLIEPMVIENVLFILLKLVLVAYPSFFFCSTVSANSRGQTMASCPATHEKDGIGRV
jgi:hypothetical protein